MMEEKAVKPETQATQAAGILTTSRVALALDEIQLERGSPEGYLPIRRSKSSPAEQMAAKAAECQRGM
jgi:hypothetical protein